MSTRFPLFPARHGNRHRLDGLHERMGYIASNQAVPYDDRMLFQRVKAVEVVRTQHGLFKRIPSGTFIPESLKCFGFFRPFWIFSPVISPEKYAGENSNATIPEKYVRQSSIDLLLDLVETANVFSRRARNVGKKSAYLSILVKLLRRQGLL